MSAAEDKDQVTTGVITPASNYYTVLHKVLRVNSFAAALLYAAISPCETCQVEQYQRHLTAAARASHWIRSGNNLNLSRWAWMPTQLHYN